MKKTMSFIFLAFVFVASGLFLSTTKIYAATCDNGTEVPADLTTTEEIGAFCAENGGNAVFSPTEVDGCDKGASFLGFPKWYKFLEGVEYEDASTGRVQCQPAIKNIKDIWLIVAAVIEIMLRVAALLAIGFIVYGGVTYTTSQGQPDKTKQALQTIISSFVGLTIAIIATAVVTFIAGRF